MILPSLIFELIMQYAIYRNLLNLRFLVLINYIFVNLWLMIFLFLNFISAFIFLLLTFLQVINFIQSISYNFHNIN